MNKKIPVIIDCDPGIDDALALLILYKHREMFDVKLITSISGNCSIETTSKNIQFLAAQYFPNTPIAKGASHGLVKYSKSISEDVHGSGGLGSVKIKKQNYSIADNAVEEMYKIISSSRTKITLITLGALTNIAKLIINYPETKQKIERIYSMIGSIDGNGNIEPYAECNAFFDPEAFDIVSKSGIPMTINPLELAQNSKVPKASFKDFQALNKHQQLALDLLSSINEYKDPINIGLYDIHSVLAIIRPELYEYIPCDINVYTNTIERGKCILTKNKNSKNYYQVLKDANLTNTYIINELFNL